MSSRKAFVCILLGFILVLAGCEETPTKPVAKKEQKPVVPIDGQSAFFRMFVAARTWSPDAQGLRLESHDVPAVPRAGGKFGAWRAMFVSASKRRSAVFNYAVVELGGKWQKGVFQDHAEGYTGGLEKPWPPAALKTSSQKALDVAMARKEAKQYMKKNPDKPILILLERTDRHPNVAWRIVWGERVSTSGFSVFVDASTGDFLEVMR